jgi:hypothetical protein
VQVFKLEIYGTVIGLVVAALAFLASLDLIVLSATLHLTGSFSAYLFIGAALCFEGAALFLMLSSANL